MSWFLLFDDPNVDSNSHQGELIRTIIGTWVESRNTWLKDSE